MMKQLSIIITHHNETPEQVSRAVASVTMQVGVDLADIEILLVGDGVPPLPKTLFPAPSELQVRQLNYQPAKGAGVARQVGIDNTTGQFFMFIDADDVLQDVFVLRDMLLPVQTANYDMVIARYTKQQLVQGHFAYTLSAEFDWKAAYAKLYNRSYIGRLGLRWAPDLKIFEDTYYVGLACELAHTRKYISRPVYAWLWNPNSTVRKNNHSFNHQLHVWARSNRYSLAVLRQKKPAVWPRDFYQYMADLFYRAKLYPPADMASFVNEQTALLVANRVLWNEDGRAQILSHARKLREPNQPYAGQSLEGLEAYLMGQTQLLKQAYQREVEKG